MINNEQCEDDRPTRTIMLGWKKAGIFRYYTPIEIRKFINSDDLKGKVWDTDNFSVVF